MLGGLVPRITWEGRVQSPEREGFWAVDSEEDAAVRVASAAAGNRVCRFHSSTVTAASYMLHSRSPQLATFSPAALINGDAPSLPTQSPVRAGGVETVPTQTPLPPLGWRPAPGARGGGEL